MQSPSNFPNINEPWLLTHRENPDFWLPIFLRPPPPLPAESLTRPIFFAVRACSIRMVRLRSLDLYPQFYREGSFPHGDPFQQGFLDEHDPGGIARRSLIGALEHYLEF